MISIIDRITVFRQLITTFLSRAGSAITSPRRLQKTSLCISLMVALECFGQSAYIHVKAVFAQFFVELAWHNAQRLGAPHKPWPWADAMPVAALSVPSLGIRQYVLNSHAGEALAFGPGMITNEDARAPVRVLAGHRDTHFKFLEDVHPGMLFTLELLDGQAINYRVIAHHVLDVRVDALPFEALESTLFLVTCYPFRAIDHRGPLRYVLEATEV